MKNGVTTSLLFFLFENAKNLGRSDDGKRRKKRGWPHGKENTITIYYRQCTPMRQRVYKTFFIFAFLHVVPFCYTEPFYPVKLRPNFALFMRRTNFSGFGS